MLSRHLHVEIPSLACFCFFHESDILQKMENKVMIEHVTLSKKMIGFFFIYYELLSLEVRNYTHIYINLYVCRN